jgi:hypothetical protein
MRDEGKLRDAELQGLRAKQLLENELLASAFDGLEQEYTKALFLTHIDQPQAREKLFLAVNVVRKVRDHLAAMVNNGQLANRELKDLADTAERKKQWGDV